MDKQIFKIPKIQKSIIASAIILFGLLLVFILLRKLLDWPGADTEKTVLIGIFIFCFLPFILIIVEIIVKYGGKFKWGDIEVDFSSVRNIRIQGFRIPANIGARGQQARETNINTLLGKEITTADQILSQQARETNINTLLDALSKAFTYSIVIVDLEDGLAWWETRLLVLLSGAQRLGYPDKIVFLADKPEKKQCFIGWAYPDLLLKCLLKARPQYLRSYAVAKAVSNQWWLVEPYYPSSPPNSFDTKKMTWLQTKAIDKSEWAFDNNTGLPKDFLEEQVLQYELNREFEMQVNGLDITTGKITDLFETVLHTNYIDQNDTSTLQLKKLYADDLPFIALTQDGKYVSLVSRFALYNQILEKLTIKEEDKKHEI